MKGKKTSTILPSPTVLLQNMDLLKAGASPTKCQLNICSIGTSLTSEGTFVPHSNHPCVHRQDYGTYSIKLAKDSECRGRKVLTWLLH